MRDAIRRWLGLDQLATKDDIRGMWEIREFDKAPFIPPGKLHKLNTLPVAPITFEQMQAEALKAQEDTDGRAA